ncbi:hypothetical protein [Delftia sp. RIT313]|uniref:hypothetical protein n=1 Tax=Delftia sp. RIT313 TaxID=1468410 RepID=UPI000449B1B0|nr:hypothetical protein [Delftia sp. RIT313]EZP56360.1 hypothetical protein BW39_01673 [Delftia sp. RIT313]
MDTAQLISGIGSAVASAQSQNHCFVWCMTKSEWSSWVQAIGSVIALIVAIWISRAPIRIERKGAVVNARHFVISLIEATQGLTCGVQSNKKGVIVLTSVALNENIAAVRLIRPEVFPPDVMHAFVNLKLMAVQISVTAKAYEERPTESNARDFLRFLGLIAVGINHHAQLIFEKVNGVESVKLDSNGVAARVIESFKKMDEFEIANHLNGGDPQNGLYQTAQAESPPTTPNQ